MEVFTIVNVDNDGFSRIDPVIYKYEPKVSEPSYVIKYLYELLARRHFRDLYDNIYITVLEGCNNMNDQENKCDEGESTEDLVTGPDPFIEDVCNRIEIVTLCKQCYKDSCDDI